jgi:hypothetical protein
MGRMHRCAVGNHINTPSILRELSLFCNNADVLQIFTPNLPHLRPTPILLRTAPNNLPRPIPTPVRLEVELLPTALVMDRLILNSRNTTILGNNFIKVVGAEYPGEHL